jgi:hypothetical protein
MTWLMHVGSDPDFLGMVLAALLQPFASALADRWVRDKEKPPDES